MDHIPAWLLRSFNYLCAAVIAVPLSKALGLGAIIGTPVTTTSGSGRP